jgi:adenylyl cyclase-associated protein
VEWARALKELYVPGLRNFVKSHYPLGPVWSATGSAVSAPPKAAPKPGAPAPPPPPPASLFTSESSQPSSSRPKEGMAAVFQEIGSKPVTAGSFLFLLLVKSLYYSLRPKNIVPITFLICSKVIVHF